MLGMRRGLLSIAHSRATVVVLIGDGPGLLWDIEIPKDATNKEGDTADVSGRHEFSLCGRECHCGLELGLVDNCSAS